jgi:hypothetical protein
MLKKGLHMNKKEFTEMFDNEMKKANINPKSCLFKDNMDKDCEEFIFLKNYITNDLNVED